MLDTTARAMQANYRFSVLDAQGAAVAVSSVTLTGPDTVKIVTAQPATGGRLRYGAGLSGGNLRDTQGEAIVFDGGGQNFPLHNWCLIFSEQL